MIEKFILSLAVRWLKKEALELLIDKLADLLAEHAIDAVEQLLVKLAKKLAEHTDSKATHEFADTIEQVFNSK